MTGTGLALALALALPRPAVAQQPGVTTRGPSTSEQLLAESLFTEGRTLMDQGRFAEACAKLAESQRLDPGGGTLLNLAVCHEKEGRLGTAYVELNAALAQAQQENRKDRAEVARARLGAIAPRLPKLAVHVLADEPELEVMVDGTLLRRPAWGVAAVVDPGPHLVEATAPGKTRFSVKISVAEAEKRTVDVPPLVGPQTAPPGTTDALPRADLTVPPARSSSGSSGKTVAAIFAAGGFTVAGIAAAIWFPYTLMRRSGCDDARRYCTDSGLSALKVEQPAFYTAVVSGGIGLGGLVAFLLIPQGSGLAPAPTQGGASVTFSTTF